MVTKHDQAASPRSIGVMEFSSIGVGYRVQDQMLKAADVQVVVARTICSGKYIVILAGGVSEVNSAMAAGLEQAGEALVDHLSLPNVHAGVFPALAQSVMLQESQAQALGVVETFSGASIIAAADAAAKAADVVIFRIHVAMALGGKGFCLLAGAQHQVEAAVAAAAAEASRRGLLVSQIVIPRPSRELFAEYI